MRDYNMKDLINTLSSQSGLYGLFANTAFGATTWLMQMAEAAADMNGGTAIGFSLELSKEEWYKRMQSIGLPIEHFTVIDEPCPTDQMIEHTIKSIEDARLIAIDYLELLDQDTSRKLSAIAKQYSMPIFVCGRLARNSGAYDPNNRPELISVRTLFEPNQFVPLHAFDFLALLHRDHDCDRGNNIRRYNISNTAELIMKVNRFGKIGSIFFEWNEQRSCFDI